MPILSIIVPVYNVEYYIEECIYSIINQSFEDFELIIINDGSTDRSPLLIERLSNEDSRIKVIHQKNMGLPEARNKGIEAATGSFIGFIDSDDKIKTNMYDLMLKEFEVNGGDIVVCNFLRFDRKEIINSKRYTDKVIKFNNNNSLEFYKYAIDSSCNKVFKSEIIKKYNIRFEDKSVVPQEDYYFLMKYLAHTEKISTLGKQLYEYRNRKSSITKSKQPKGFMEGSFRFVELTRKYHERNKINRNITSFEWYLFYSMMQSVINNDRSNKFKEMFNSIRFFQEKIIFKEAISFNKNHFNQREGKLRVVYNLLVLSLYEKGAYFLVAILEYLRVRMLHRRSVENNYFR